METFDSQTEETATAEVEPTELDAEQAGMRRLFGPGRGTGSHRSTRFD